MAIKGARADNLRITPHLLVRGGKKAIEFYTRAFGAAVLYESPMPHGPGLHAHLQIGKTMIMITDERPPSPDGIMFGIAAPESLGATTTILECYVEDVDSAFQRAVSSAMVRANCCGDDITGSTSSARILARPGSARKPCARIFWMRSAISGGRPAGATTPYQNTSSKSLTPWLAKVGTLGTAADGRVTAKPVNLFSRTRPAEPDGLSSITATVPFIRSG